MTQAPDGIELTWTRPTEYVDGSRMLDLAGFEIQRSDPDENGKFQKHAVIEVTDRDRFRQARKFRYLDQEAVPSHPYSYRVVSFTLDGYLSAPSNVATIDTTSDIKEPHAPLPTPQR